MIRELQKKTPARYNLKFIIQAVQVSFPNHHGSQTTSFRTERETIRVDMQLCGGAIPQKPHALHKHLKPTSNVPFSMCEKSLRYVIHPPVYLQTGETHCFWSRHSDTIIICHPTLKSSHPKWHPSKWMPNEDKSSFLSTASCLEGITPMR